MNETEKIKALKLMIDSSDTDEVLATYLMIAGKKILARAYPYNDEIKEVPSKYEMVQLEIATYLLNKRGAEGQLTHSENGISRTYENADVPKSMLQAIVPCCGIIK